MPNKPESLKDRKDIYICASHFKCEWVRVRGGKSPIGPPTYFKGVLKSSHSQCVTRPRPSIKATSAVRNQLHAKYIDKCDKIEDFITFAEEFERRFTSFIVKNHGDELTFFMEDELGRKVVQYFCFKKVNSCFGFLHLAKVEKNPKENFQSTEK